jgi:tRNA1Val (adenine37-N6)-methyltransferase
MSKYSQPDFYRFNEDSINLVKWIQSTGIKPKRILDLGAGSGVLGIELALLLNPQELTFVEVQKEFQTHLETNCRCFLSNSVAHSIIIKSFLDFKSDQKFDLIVCNPPYYLPGNGELPQDPKRAIARTFLIDSWPILLKTISDSMSAEGKGFIVLKEDQALLESISQHFHQFDLDVKKNDVGSIMILELFRLNKN